MLLTLHIFAQLQSMLTKSSIACRHPWWPLGFRNGKWEWKSSCRFSMSFAQVLICTSNLTQKICSWIFLGSMVCSCTKLPRCIFWCRQGYASFSGVSSCCSASPEGLFNQQTEINIHKFFFKKNNLVSQFWPSLFWMWNFKIKTGIWNVVSRPLKLNVGGLWAFLHFWQAPNINSHKLSDMTS